MILAVTVNIVLATIALTATVGLILWAIRSSAPQPTPAPGAAARVRQPGAWSRRVAPREAATASQR